MSDVRNGALCIPEHRRDERLSSDDPEAGVSNLMADEYVDYSDLEAVKLQKSILSLPAKQQLAFNLRYYDELEYDRIAAITGSTAAHLNNSYIKGQKYNHIIIHRLISQNPLNASLAITRTCPPLPIPL